MSRPELGQTNFQTASFYESRGYGREIKLSSPLTEDQLDEIRSVGAWINQNYLVRIYAILEANGVIPKDGSGEIDQTLSGWYDVDLLRRLRNQYAHSTGYYSPDDPKERKLYESIVEYYGVDEALSPDEAIDFPLSIDKVLMAMTDGCQSYLDQL